MPIFKRCSRCGKRIREGEKCTCIDKRYKEEDKYTANDKEKLFYRTALWQRKRDYISKKYGGIDIYSYIKYGRLEQGQTVHHIVPLKDNWALRLENSNLIYLTNQNHQQIHADMSISKENYLKVINELQALLIQAENIWGYGVC